MKSGTTICGIQLKDVVILAADTRSTSGPMVADKNCEKLHYMAKNVYCAGAGTAADLQHTTEMMESQMELSFVRLFEVAQNGATCLLCDHTNIHIAT
mmetsp:Transcript_14527/g.17377  ORF Transcript_14527/g.17377 Transcript_14527/m.17377 type:complete len:97 (+) Transcript_14527:71-361(+)